MYPTVGMLFRVALLAAAIWWIAKVVDRLSSDIETLRDTYRKYKTRHDPEVLERMRTERRRKNYQETRVLEFRSEVIALAFIWGLTALAALYLLGTVIIFALRLISIFS